MIGEKRNITNGAPYAYRHYELKQRLALSFIYKSNNTGDNNNYRKNAKSYGEHGKIHVNKYTKLALRYPNQIG